MNAFHRGGGCLSVHGGRGHRQLIETSEPKLKALHGTARSPSCRERGALRVSRWQHDPGGEQAATTVPSRAHRSPCVQVRLSFASYVVRSGITIGERRGNAVIERVSWSRLRVRNCCNYPACDPLASMRKPGAFQSLCIPGGCCFPQLV